MAKEHGFAVKVQILDLHARVQAENDCLHGVSVHSEVHLKGGAQLIAGHDVDVARQPNQVGHRCLRRLSMPGQPVAPQPIAGFRIDAEQNRYRHAKRSERQTHGNATACVGTIGTAVRCGCKHNQPDRSQQPCSTLDQGRCVGQPRHHVRRPSDVRGQWRHPGREIRRGTGVRPHLHGKHNDRDGHYRQSTAQER